MCVLVLFWNSFTIVFAAQSTHMIRLLQRPCISIVQTNYQNNVYIDRRSFLKYWLMWLSELCKSKIFRWNRKLETQGSVEGSRQYPVNIPSWSGNVTFKLIGWGTPMLGRVLCFIQGFPGGSEVKVSAWNEGGQGSIPEFGRYPGERNGNSL